MTLEELREFLSSPKNIVVTNHINPDGDAMGSALGLKSVLTMLGHHCKVVVPNSFPTFLNWMVGASEVIIADEQTEESTKAINEAELIIVLDYNSLSRSGVLEPLLRDAKAKLVMIDHHQQPQDFADLTISDPTKSSTCEMVFDFLNDLDFLSSLDKGAAEALYAGILTDTGSFRFSSTSSDTLRKVAHLMDLGVEPHIVNQAIFDNNSIARLKLLGNVLEELVFYKEKQTAFLFISKEVQQKYHYQKGDSEGFVNYGLSLSGVSFSAFFREEEDGVKISLRSKGSFDVNQIARKHFNGGGHINAAGGFLPLSLEKAKEYFNQILDQIAP